MNVAGLVQLHEGERHHESDSAPLQTPDNRFKHPRNILARELRRSTSRALASPVPRCSFSERGAFSCNDHRASVPQNPHVRKCNATPSADLGTVS